MPRIVIGLVGPIASGKDIVIDQLAKIGFRTYFLGDRTREEADRRGLSHDRSILQDMGNDLREKFGDDILVKRTEELFEKAEKIIVDGIRSPGEIAYLRGKYHAIIIGVNARVETRRKFSKKRKGDADPASSEEFERVEQRDRGIGETSHGQHVERCLALSDIVIENNGTVSQFKKKTQEALARLNL